MSGPAIPAASAPTVGRSGQPTLRDRLAGWSPELRQSVRTLVSVLLAYLFAHALHLREPYWALVTAVIVTQARISSTIEAGRDQIVGTLIGAAAGAVAIALQLDGLPRVPVFAALMVPIAILGAFKPNLRLAGVALVVTFLFPSEGGPFDRPVDRVLAILVGAAVSLLVSYVVFRTRARAQAFEAAAAMLAALDATRTQVLAAAIEPSVLERLNDGSGDALKTLVAAIAEARRERLTALDQHEPLMLRLVPMLRRLQSDMLFVARAVHETEDAVPGPALAPVSAAIGAVLQALAGAMRQEARQRAHQIDQALVEVGQLQEALATLGDHAGPLPRFTLEMLSRDLADIATALRPENNDRTP